MNLPTRVFLQLIAVLFAVLIALLFLGAASFLVMVKAGNYYDSHHAIPDPVARGDDLGIGLYAIYWLMGSLLITAPSSILVCMFVYRFLSGKLSKRKTGE